MKKIEVFELTDGNLVKCEELAKIKQNELDFRKWYYTESVNTLRFEGEFGLEIVSVENLIDYLYLHKSKILDFLK